jgi:hypothetical protein
MMICTIRSKQCCVYNGIGSPYLVLHRPNWSTDVPQLRKAIEESRNARGYLTSSCIAIMNNTQSTSIWRERRRCSRVAMQSRQDSFVGSSVWKLQLEITGPNVAKTSLSGDPSSRKWKRDPSPFGPCHTSFNDNWRVMTPLSTCVCIKLRDGVRRTTALTSLQSPICFTYHLLSQSW